MSIFQQLNPNNPDPIDLFNLAQSATQAQSNVPSDFYVPTDEQYGAAGLATPAQMAELYPPTAGTALGIGGENSLGGVLNEHVVPSLQSIGNRAQGRADITRQAAAGTLPDLPIVEDFDPIARTGEHLAQTGDALVSGLQSIGKRAGAPTEDLPEPIVPAVAAVPMEPMMDQATPMVGGGQDYSPMGLHGPAQYSPVENPMIQQIEQQAIKGAEGILGTGSVWDEQQLFGLVKGAGSAIGNGLSMTWDAWKKLSPSTKAGLVGAAASAFAYSRGAYKTSDTLMKGTLGLYSGMADREAAQSIATQKAEAASAKLTGAATAKAMDAAKKSVNTDTINDLANSEAFDHLSQTAGKLWGTSLADEDKPAVVRRMGSIYKQLIDKRLISPSVDFMAWATNPERVQATMALLREKQGVTL